MLFYGGCRAAITNVPTHNITTKVPLTMTQPSWFDAPLNFFWDFCFFFRTTAPKRVSLCTGTMTKPFLKISQRWIIKVSCLSTTQKHCFFQRWSREKKQNQLDTFTHSSDLALKTPNYPIFIGWKCSSPISGVSCVIIIYYYVITVISSSVGSISIIAMAVFCPLVLLHSLVLQRLWAG